MPDRRVIAILFAALLIALSCAAQAQDDPRDKLMPRKDGLSACFRRDYDAAHLKANPAQATQSILLSLKYQDGNIEGLILRAMMKRKDSPKPYFMMGGCDWAEHKTPGAQAARILGSARHSRGLDCIMLESRESARESGEIIVDFSADMKTAIAVSDNVIAAWHGMDQSEAAPDLSLSRDDVVFKLTRTDEKACRAMEQGIRF
jgi:hypothetical protein